MIKKFPARYFLISLTLMDGRVINWDKAQWDAQFIPRTPKRADIIILPTHWAFAQQTTLSQILPGLRLPVELKHVEYSIMCHNEKSAHWEHFEHPFNPKNKTMLTRDGITCRSGNLFREYSLGFLMESKGMRGQKAIQFIS